MDGVLLDSERVWRKYGEETFRAVGITEIPENIRKQIYGISMKDEYTLLKTAVNIQVSLEEYIANYDRFSAKVYTESALAVNLEGLLQKLKERELRLAIISASLKPWIDLALNRLQRQDYFEQVISIADTPDLKQKPEPDGYLRAMEILGLAPTEVVVVEDSNRGIQSGKASGAFTIATEEFIDDSYQQVGFDTKIKRLEDVLELIA